MAVPKKKTSKSKSKSRRAANTKVTSISLVKCSKCGELKRAHLVCGFCGYYKGKKIIDVESKLDKKLRKSEKEKEKSEKK